MVNPLAVMFFARERTGRPSNSRYAEAWDLAPLSRERSGTPLGSGSRTNLQARKSVREEIRTANRLSSLFLEYPRRGEFVRCTACYA